MIRLALALCIVISSTMAQADGDPFAKGGCFTVAEANAIMETHAGKVIMNMYGDRNDAQFKDDYRWTFVRYLVDGQYQTALFQRDLPQSMSPTKLCVWLRPVSGKTEFKNPAAGKPPAQNIVKPVDESVARSSCPQRLARIQAARGNRLERLGGKWVTADAALKAMRQVAGVSDADAEADERKDRAKSVKGGDARCDSLAGIIRSRAADGMKLVAMFFDKNYLDNAGEQVIDSLHALFVSDSGNGRWQLYGYADEGSAAIEASGNRFDVQPGIFK